jgi:16S rRNA (cytidine1402-2'-O)-methyltransferase
MNKKGSLYVLPNFLGDTRETSLLPGEVAKVLAMVKHFAVEEIRSARQLIARMDKTIDINTLHFYDLNEHTTAQQVSDLMSILKTENMAIISEAGCAAVADPGASLVRLAQEKDIAVIPLTGPSSIILALMASGLNGQSFSFEGYLPKERPGRIGKIKELESSMNKTGQTKIFIETPYRNDHLMEDLLTHCNPKTLLCIAVQLQGPEETIRTRTIAAWKKNQPKLAKQPAVFLLGK